MNKKQLIVAWVIRILAIFSVLNLTSCAAIRKIDKVATERARKKMAALKQGQKDQSKWFKKYITDIVYFMMPEKEFVKLFEKQDNWLEYRPYIISRKENKKENKYVIYGIRPIKYGKAKHKMRVIFREGVLVRFEHFGFEKTPFMGIHAYDYTNSLRGFPKTEEDFLRIYSDSILSSSENTYVFIAKDGKKYRYTFQEGRLLSAKSLDW
ncbi:MAG: hypothetical protein ABH872_01305 [Candidatus Omnitrophota bacterium]